MFFNRPLATRRLTAALGVASVLVAGAASAATAATGAVTTTDSATTATAGSLPFAMPSTETLRASDRKAFAHYLPSLPISVDNKDAAADTYALQYLTPGGEKGKHAAYGGFLRDRPAPRPVRTDKSWALADAEAEVRQAIAAGLDGFTLDLLQLPGDPAAAHVWTHSERMMKAAANVDPGFKIVLMPDMSASKASQNPATLAKYVAELAEYPSAYRLADGRLVVSPFIAEKQPATWWATFNRIMADQYGERVALVPLFLNEMPYSKEFAAVSYGMSHWGARNAAWNEPTATNGSSRLGRVKQIHDKGKIWMQPISVQDVRPRTGLYEEAENTTNLRNTWQIAISSKSDWVQLATWNDYTEGTQMAPSAKNGWSYLDVNAYYLTWWKTGKAPAITQDAVYLTHRTQFAAAKPSYHQKRMMNIRGGSKARDMVEALTFLTKPGTVKITAGSKTYSCNAPAGAGVCTVALGTGTVSAAVVRGSAAVAAVTSAHPVTARPVVQDLEYAASSSLRTPGRAVVTAPVAESPAAVPATPATPATPAAPAAPKPAGKATTMTVSALIDGYANSNAKARTYGTAGTLVSAGAPAATSYLAFALPKAAAGKTLRSATLRFTTTTSAAAGSGATHDVSLAGSFTEKTLSWADRPATGTKIGTIKGAAKKYTRYGAALDVTRIAGLTGTQTFSVSSTGKDSLWMFSSESKVGQRPELVLSYS